jgi:hypothetical protein
MDKAAPSVWMPALIGGAVFGVLGALPIVGALNCACCSLVIGSGFLAAFLYSRECRKSDVPFSGGGGAKIGAVAGIFYAVFSGIVSGLVRLAGIGGFDQAIEQIESNPNIPPETAERLTRIFGYLGSGAGMLVAFLVVLVLALIFATIGGLIGGAVFKVQPPPPAQPPAQAPQM